MEGEFRKIFDTIPEQFDAYRPRYCTDLFTDLISYADIGKEKSVLELGPGTGQATDPILATGCDYHAIELGEHLAQKMTDKYGQLPNFHIVNDDFITYDFGSAKFDMIYSAATIQWIPENTAYTKTFDLLKPETQYKHGTFSYQNAVNYGYTGFEKREYHGTREFTSDEYVALCGTHCDHLVIPESYKSEFFNGLKQAVLDAGNKIVFNDTFIMYLVRKPE